MVPPDVVHDGKDLPPLTKEVASATQNKNTQFLVWCLGLCRHNDSVLIKMNNNKNTVARA